MFWRMLGNLIAGSLGEVIQNEMFQAVLKMLLCQFLHSLLVS